MKIGLLNLEPHYRNFALEKCRLFHQQRGDSVIDDFIDGSCDMVYCSSIFDFTNKAGRVPPNAIYGGTVFNLQTTLPPEIDNIEPHLNFGFTTRGCIRHCKFCVVPQKEGRIHIVGDLLSLWDRRSTRITLYDNNILALPTHFAMVCEQARHFKLQLDFNQGLDHRLLTPEVVNILTTIRHKEYRFAFDHVALMPSVEKAITLLQNKGVNRCNWYILVGFDSTLNDDLVRLNYLRDRNQIAYVQRFKGQRKPKIKRNTLELIALGRWVNQHHIFRGMTWEQFLNDPRNRRYAQLNG